MVDKKLRLLDRIRKDLVNLNSRLNPEYIGKDWGPTEPELWKEIESIAQVLDTFKDVQVELVKYRRKAMRHCPVRKIEKILGIERTADMQEPNQSIQASEDPLQLYSAHTGQPI